MFAQILKLNAQTPSDLNFSGLNESSVGMLFGNILFQIAKKLHFDSS